MEMKKIKNVILVYDDGSITNHSSKSALDILKKENREKVERIKIENKEIKSFVKKLRYQKSKQTIVFFYFFDKIYWEKVDEIGEIFLNGDEKYEIVRDCKNIAIQKTAKYFGIHRDTVSDKLTRELDLYSIELIDLLFGFINYREKDIFYIVIEATPTKDLVIMKDALNKIYREKIW